MNGARAWACDFIEHVIIRKKESERGSGVVKFLTREIGAVSETVDRKKRYVAGFLDTAARNGG
jgi:hypothetical protein